jgi:hypothetical protein
MLFPHDDVEPGPAYFSELCPRCGCLVSATFCDEDSCRRRFVLSVFRSHLLCPIHDPSVPRDALTATMSEAMRCHSCGQNLYGIKAEDGERWKPR